MRHRVSGDHLTHLTKREREMVRFLLCGMSTKGIAASCSISEYTVREHIHNAMEKKGLNSRLKFVLAAHQHPEWLTECSEKCGRDYE